MNEFYYAVLDNGWTVGRFHALDEVKGVVHAVTTRQGLDVGLVRTDHAAASAQLAGALKLDSVAFVEQVHGGVVLQADQLCDLRPDKGGMASSFAAMRGRTDQTWRQTTPPCHPEADGLVTDRAGLGVMMRGADCPLILAVDPVRSVVGSAHASWRGTVCQVAAELVRRMAGLGAAAERIVACVCPSAGPCCYEVGPDVIEAMTQKVGPHTAGFFHRRGDGTYLDLWSANRDQLIRAGLLEKNIHVSGVCTMCANDIFPSHRREGAAAGRFAAVIGRL